MGVGVGVVLVVLGALMLWTLEVDVLGVQADTLGIVVMVLGFLVMVLALIMNARRTNSRRIVEARRREGPPRG